MRTSEGGAVATSAHRFVLPEFLSLQECKELEFIHKSNGVFGYRPFVLSTTLSHLVATNCAHLIIPILSVRGVKLTTAICKSSSRRLLSTDRSCTMHQPAVNPLHWGGLILGQLSSHCVIVCRSYNIASSERILNTYEALTDTLPSVSQERVKEAVEEYFGREYELFVEFTGLMRPAVSGLSLHCSMALDLDGSSALYIWKSLLSYMAGKYVNDLLLCCSWTQGANIGWHSDDNRSYLRQRHYSAVCYLNTYERDFKGGLFHFQEGEPSLIIPSIGTLVIYTADERNIHRVDEVTEGERCTLALWFSADRVHDEDQKLIQQISLAVPDIQAHPSHEQPGKEVIKLPSKQNDHHPVAASNVMYKAQNLQNEANQLVEGSTILELTDPYFNITDDLRNVRLAQMDFSCCFSCPAVDDQHDNPVVLTYRHQEVPYLFSNSLEALQVAEFHRFKKWSPGFSGQHLDDPRWKSFPNASDSSHSQIKAGHCSTTTMPATACRDGVAPRLNQEGVSMEYLADANEVLGSPVKADEELGDFLGSVQQFQDYSSDLWRKLSKCFPSWRTAGSFLLSDL